MLIRRGETQIQLRVRKRDYRRSIKLFNKISQADIKNHEALYWLGASYARDNHIQEGIECIEKAIEISPNDPKMFTALGNLFLKISNYKEAYDSCMKSLKLDPNLRETLELRSKLELNI